MSDGFSAETQIQLQDRSVDDESSRLSSSENDSSGNGMVASDEKNEEWEATSNFESFRLKSTMQGCIQPNSASSEATGNQTHSNGTAVKPEHCGSMSSFSLGESNLGNMDSIMYNRADEDVGPSSCGDGGELTSRDDSCFSEGVDTDKAVGALDNGTAVFILNRTDAVNSTSTNGSPNEILKNGGKTKNKKDTNGYQKGTGKGSSLALEKQTRSRKSKKMRCRTFTPSFTGKITNRADVEQIFDAARRKMCKIISERIDATGVSLVGKGFIFDANAEGGLQRWTEGLSWSRSRPNRFGFQLYNEVTDQLRNDKIVRMKKEGGLLKYTATDRTEGSTLHCVWYTRKAICPKNQMHGDEPSSPLVALAGETSTKGNGMGFNGSIRAVGDMDDVMANSPRGGSGGSIPRSYQPLFQQLSNYDENDLKETGEKDEIQEFNKAANAAWKYYQRNKRKGSRGGMDGDPGAGPSGPLRHPYDAGFYPPVQDFYTGGGYWTPSDNAGMEPSRYRRELAGPHGIAGGFHGNSMWPSNGSGGGALRRIDAIARDQHNGMQDRDRDRDRDYAMGQPNIMPRMNRKYALDDLYSTGMGGGGGGSGQGSIYSREARAEQGGFEDAELQKMRREAYPEYRDRGDLSGW